MTVSTEVMSWVRLCWRVWPMLSMSFVTRLSMSPRGWPSKYLQRQPAELAVDVLPQPVDGPLGDAGHDVGLHPAEHRAEQEDADEEEQDPAERPEVEADAGRDVHRREHVRELVLTLGAQPGDDWALRHARRELLADDAREDVVGRVAQDLRADDGERDADDGQAR